MKSRTIVFYALCLGGAGLLPNPTLAQNIGAVTHSISQRKVTTDANVNPFQFRQPASFGLVARIEQRAYFSRGTNLFNATATSGSETWIATESGVKVVDRSKNTVRHYTAYEGLPGEKTLAIGADAESAFCIQTFKNKEANEVAFCSLDKKSSNWKSLKLLPPNTSFDQHPKLLQSGLFSRKPARKLPCLDLPGKSLFRHKPCQKRFWRARVCL